MRFSLLAALAVTSSAQLILRDNNAVVDNLFQETVNCTVVAGANFCTNSFIAWVCPVTCAANINPTRSATAYCVDQGDILQAQFGVPCDHPAVNAGTCAQPAVAMTCPVACNTVPFGCPATISSPPPPPPLPPPPPSGPCGFWCHHYTCSLQQCSGCPTSTCPTSHCASWCNSWTCIASVSFFARNCGACTVCSTPASRRQLDVVSEKVEALEQEAAELAANLVASDVRSEFVESISHEPSAVQALLDKKLMTANVFHLADKL